MSDQIDVAQFGQVMQLEEIKKLVPHRYPFLLIDRIIEWKLGERIVALKNISASEPILQGHFPDYPVLPGVVVVEAMAQASAVLGRLTDPGASSVLLTEIGAARFRRQVIPGDVLRLEVDVVKHRKPFFWFNGKALIDGELVTEVKFSARLA